MNTSSKGNIALAAVLSKMTQMGYSASLPFGDGCRYDLILDDNGKLLRVQCKFGQLVNGVIKTPVSSPTRKTKEKGWGRNNYVGYVDVFAIYCVATDKVYIVPINEVGNTEITLRVDQPKKMRKDIRWATKYEMGM